MTLSRRDLASLIPAFAVALPSQAESAALPTKGYSYDELAVKSNGANRSRAVLKGVNRSGFAIEMHMTQLGPRAAPHSPHKHVHEELLMLRTGSLEVTMEGQTATYDAGSSVYVASNVEHGWKNAGDEAAEYFVIALGNEA